MPLVVAPKISTPRVCLGTILSKIVSGRGRGRGYCLPTDIGIMRLCIIMVVIIQTNVTVIPDEKGLWCEVRLVKGCSQHEKLPLKVRHFSPHMNWYSYHFNCFKIASNVFRNSCANFPSHFWHIADPWFHKAVRRVPDTKMFCSYKVITIIISVNSVFKNLILGQFKM